MSNSPIEAVVTILESLEACGNGRNSKLNILREVIDAPTHTSTYDYLKLFFLWTYDWRRTYGITIPDASDFMAIPERPFTNAWLVYVSTQSLSCATTEVLFNSLLEALRRRQITGHSARNVAEDFLLSVRPSIRKWLVRVINRDLQIGISTTTINKIFRDLIPEFPVQLADVYTSDTELLFPVVVEPKLDGLRVLIKIDVDQAVGGNVIASVYSRSGKDIPCLQFIADEIADRVRRKSPTARFPVSLLDRSITSTSIWFDGEALSSEGWNQTISLLKTKPSNLTEAQLKSIQSNVRLFLFNVIIDEANWPLSLSRLFLEELFADPSDSIKVVYQERVNDLKQFEEMYQFFLDSGFEGMMIKDPQIGWTEGRSSAWLKYKPEMDMDVEVIDVLEGDSPRTQGKLGRFRVRDAQKNEFFVGGGFTLKDRERFWAMKDQMIGKIIEIKVQKDPKQVAVARFPVFKRVREDKTKI